VITQSFTIDAGGGKMPAYLARPDGEEPRAAIIVLQEIFGVNTEVKRIADLAASAGYVALAINYYHRTHPELNEPYTPEGLQNGFKAAGAVTRAGLAADIGAARDWLGTQRFVSNGKIATWGFCFGGTVAFFSATLPGIGAAVAFYGGNIAAGLPCGEPEMLADTAQLRAPLLLVFGGQDAYIPADAVERIRSTVGAAKKDVTIEVFADQDHGFFRHSSSEMAPGSGAKAEANAKAWTLVQNFLKEHLN
jgi:carboxymethylenebutenolidase